MAAIRSNSPTRNDDEQVNERKYPTLSMSIVGLIPLASGDHIPHPQATPSNHNAPSTDLHTPSSSSSSTNSDNTYAIRPFIDPGLVRKKPQHLNEAWLSDFQSPRSAPEGAYSALSQAVKKLLPERTACRFGCRGANCKYERSDFWRPEQMAIKGIFSHW